MPGFALAPARCGIEVGDFIFCSLDELTQMRTQVGQSVVGCYLEATTVSSSVVAEKPLIHQLPLMHFDEVGKFQAGSI